jgi:hypothetical protein
MIHSSTKEAHMKMKPEHYKAIESGLNAISSDLDKAEHEYAERGLSDKRMRWDAFRFARINGDSTKWLCDTLYPYLNDEHVDSALRRYFGHKS